MPDFECRLKKYRLLKDLTQEQLAAQVGVRRETIMRLEKAQYNPSLKLAIDISRVLNIRFQVICACTLTNLTMLLPFCVTVMIFSEILTPVANGGNVQWNHIWLLWGVGIISALLVFLAAKNDYRKTYIASYQESNATRLRIADHLRKLPMSFFNTKDLSELTTSLRNR